MTSDSSQKLTKKKLQEDIKKLQKDLEEKTKLAEERLNQLKYLQADFENYKKKFEKERENIVELSNENLIKELLIIIDDFERAIQSIENKKNKEGLILLHKNFFKILENHGLKKIEALGKKFDSYYHEAISKEKSDKEDGIILDEIQPGYMLKSKIIRHSKVKVADNKPKVEAGDKNG
jgi:molecular chaperone GrpE